MNSPVNEIFKSLTSLQEELNKQNLKQKNLEKVKQFLLERKGFLDEDFKSQEQNYINQGNEPQIVKSYIERFRKIRDKNYKQLNDQIGGLENVRDRKNIDSYKTFKELETIVDYVGGQIDLAGASLGNDIEIDAKPIHENDVFQIYYADSPRACIKYKGSIPYSWCVSRSDSSNMFYTYRFKENEPAFYFVKIKDRTKKELGFFSMVGNVFNGKFKDVYHFFVIQVVKGAKINDTTTKQYIVTSAMNDGDRQMSWNEIVAIEPRISKLQEIFKPVELSPEDKEFYNKFKNGTDDETFCKLDYTNKRRYLDIYIRQNQLLTDIQFQCLPEDLMNLYLGFGVGLSEGQFELIKTNKNLLKRYQQITEKKLEQYLKNKNQDINFNYTELLILPEDKKKELVVNLSAYNLSLFLEMPSNPKIFDMLFNIGGKDFVLNLTISKINNLLTFSKEPDKTIDILFNIGGKDFIMNLTENVIRLLLQKSSEPDKTVDILFNIGGKEFIMNLDKGGLSYIIRYSKKRDETINKLLNIGGKEFIMNLESDKIHSFLYSSSEPEKIINLLGNKGKEYIMNFNVKNIEYMDAPEKIINMLLNVGGKEYLMNLDGYDIQALLEVSKNSNILVNLILDIGGKDFIIDMDSDSISYLLQYSSEKDKIIDKLINIGGKEFIKSLYPYDVKTLLASTKEPEKIKQILKQYGKLPKEEITTPMNEIFNSLTSLQEELTEQRKQTIKETNLMKVQNFIKKRKNNQ